MARKIPGEFVPLSSNFSDDPAVLEVGPDAELLYLRGLQYAKRQRTDGHIPKVALSTVGRDIRRYTTLPQRLVTAGLWVAVNGGWNIRSWDGWNPTRAEREERSAVRRQAAQKRWATRTKGNPQ